jgi:hypothetical protein
MRVPRRCEVESVRLYMYTGFRRFFGWGEDVGRWMGGLGLDVDADVASGGWGW